MAERVLSDDIPGVKWETETGVRMQVCSIRMSLKAAVSRTFTAVLETSRCPPAGPGVHMADNMGPCPGPVVRPTPVLSQRSSVLPNKLEGRKKQQSSRDAPVVCQHTQCFGRAGESNGNTDQSCSLLAIVVHSQEWQEKKEKQSAHFSDKGSPSGITSRGK